jgi:hypothetical protein
MPHSTAWRSLCSRPCRTWAVDRHGDRASGGCGSDRPSPGWCSGCRVCAGRRGSRGNHTPYRRGPCPACCAAGRGRYGARGCPPRPVGTAGCRATDRRCRAGTAASASARPPDAAWWSARRASARDRGRRAQGRCLRVAPFGDPPFYGPPAACWWARATVDSTLTSQVIRPFASALACGCSKIRFHVPSRCHRRNRS